MHKKDAKLFEKLQLKLAKVYRIPTPELVAAPMHGPHWCSKLSADSNTPHPPHLGY